MRLIDVTSCGVFCAVTLTLLAKTTCDDTNSPTFPADALSFVAVPTIPPVVGLNATLVAVAAPRTGVTNVGDVDPAKFPLPVAPVSPLSTALFVVVLKSL